VEGRKSAYDEAYVRWNTREQGLMLRIRETFHGMPSSDYGAFKTMIGSLTHRTRGPAAGGGRGLLTEMDAVRHPGVRRLQGRRLRRRRGGPGDPVGLPLRPPRRAGDRVLPLHRGLLLRDGQRPQGTGRRPAGEGRGRGTRESRDGRLQPAHAGRPARGPLSPAGQAAATHGSLPAPLRTGRGPAHRPEAPPPREAGRNGMRRYQAISPVPAPSCLAVEVSGVFGMSGVSVPVPAAPA
jgi:hypothetical protein